jgi:hypothetical protein
MRTIAEIKETLPNITVHTKPNEYRVGNVCGRKNKFATVTFYPNGIMVSFEASWEAVARAYNENHWITY